MKMKIQLALIITLLFGAPAFADGFATGQVLDITGFNIADPSILWSGTFRLGIPAGGPFFNVSDFGVDPSNCSTCTPSSPPWTLNSLQFDSATGDLSGMASADFGGLHVGVHMLTLTFMDGNNKSDIWTDVRRTTKMGTFSYCIGANCTNPNMPPVPEPSTYMLLASGLMSLIGAWRLKCSNR
jgi:PEP-CTERM motif